MEEPRPAEARVNPNGISVSREYSISLPLKEFAYPIPATSWERLKRDIAGVDPPKNWFQSAGWAFIGTATTALLTILGRSDWSLRSNIVSWCAVVLFGVLAGTMFLNDRLQRQDIAKSTKTIVDEMCETQRMFAEQSETNAEGLK